MTLPAEPVDPSVFGRPPLKDFTAEERHAGRIKLHELRLLSHYSIPMSYVDQAQRTVDVESISRSFGERCNVMVHTSLWAHLDERIIAYRRWPKTWWDAFKARWFPLWARRRWPVEYEEFSINQPVFKAAYVNLPRSSSLDERWLYVARTSEKEKPQ